MVDYFGKKPAFARTGLPYQSSDKENSIINQELFQPGQCIPK